MLVFMCGPDDYKAFVGILLLSGHRCYPRQELFWSLDPNFDCPIVREAMPKNRFMTLKKYLHLNDNNEIPADWSDKCFKIRPLLETVNRNFMRFGYFTENYSDDDDVVLRHTLPVFTRLAREYLQVFGLSRCQGTK